MNCVVCGTTMDAALAPEVSHPSCSATSFVFDPLDSEDPFNAQLKQQLLQMILHADRQSPRTQQKQIGPSEIGDPCDRKIGYRLAGIPEVNTAFDPWPATVGTAIHAWLEKAAQTWNQDYGPTYLTEQTIPYEEFGGIGHGDLYTNGIVVDWKSASKEVMRKIRNNGPPESHVTQVQTYGYGYRRMGVPVDRVALAFVPRAGWIKDMYVWSAAYDETVATRAIGRLFVIAQDCMSQQVLTHPHRWQQIYARSSDECGRCPWFNAMRTLEQGASEQGCPGQ